MTVLIRSRHNLPDLEFQTVDGLGSIRRPTYATFKNNSASTGTSSLRTNHPPFAYKGCSGNKFYAPSLRSHRKTACGSCRPVAQISCPAFASELRQSAHDMTSPVSGPNSFSSRAGDRYLQRRPTEPGLNGAAIARIHLARGAADILFRDVAFPSCQPGQMLNHLF